MRMPTISYIFGVVGMQLHRSRKFDFHVVILGMPRAYFGQSWLLGQQNNGAFSPYFLNLVLDMRIKWPRMYYWYIVIPLYRTASNTSHIGNIATRN